MAQSIVQLQKCNHYNWCSARVTTRFLVCLELRAFFCCDAISETDAVAAQSFRSNGSQAGEWGSGAGKGGGAGGSVREAGGSFGKMEAAREEEYFRKLQKDQISKLKGHLHEEISHHEDEIKRLQDEIQRHKGKIHELSAEEGKIGK
ncbi:ATPase inhibitor A, mitochondrial-like [Stegodyphus dumicola]|uniref:ATPase inhibitor A, mitochondrial-like n=1 Tax=Stegodyphus dumicola TaxID=202533 RepID=UPI0015AE15C4|nr:ATPase inhibitor A, mitochondrial-like [Stegodyphus dumicola]